MKEYIKDYPRPQFVRNEWQNLRGKWNFIFDDKDEGENKKYFLDFPLGTQINLPFTYETKLSGIQDENVHSIVWYNKKVNISKKQIHNKKTLLHFEGSDYITKVWVNGQFVGENVGAYARFSFDIENYMVEGENDITVKVEDSLSKFQPRGKQRYKKESWRCWYIQTTGIWKTVWLEWVSKKYIEHVKNTPDINANTVELEYETNISEKEFEDNNFFIETQISFAGEIINTEKIKLTHNNQIVKMNLGCNIKKWSAETPNLYDIEYRLYCGDEKTDTVYSYFGVRKISIKGNKICLNDEELFLKLILDQGYWKDSHLTPPDEQALIKDIDAVLSLGYNGVRKHQKIEDERFLYWCDVKGVLVWSEMASCYEFNDISIQNFSEQWIKVLKQNYNHPCIITWVPINESWGVPNISVNKKQQNFVNSLYYVTKAIDDTRPVISNDGWEHTISDIITIHDYKQDGTELANLYQKNIEKVLANIEKYNLKHSLFAEGYSYKGQPIVISEYGGIAMHSEDGWGYGKQAIDESEYIKRFEELTNAIKNIPNISGYCYTQLTDVQQEINGILDENRKTKFNKEIMKKIKNLNNKGE